MIVAFKGMTIDAGIIITMVGYEFLQFHGGLRQIFYMKSHVFYQTRRAGRPRATHSWEDAGAYSPVLSVHFGVFGEADGLIEHERAEQRADGFHALQEGIVRGGLGLYEQRREVMIVAR